MKEPDAKIRRHGDGIYSRFSGRLAAQHGKATRGWVYYVTYRWNGRRITERCETDPDGACRLDTAKKLKRNREREKHDASFVPPKIKAELDALREEQERIEEQREQDRLEVLRFHAAKCKAGEQEFRGIVADFLEAPDGGVSYSSPSNVKTTLIRAGRFFNGKRLDQITDPDVYAYYLARTTATGPFEGAKAIGVRGTQAEWHMVAAVYNWAIRRGYTLTKPTPPSLRNLPKDSPLRKRRSRAPIIPTADQLHRLLTAHKRAPGGRGVQKWEGRHLVRDEHRALFALCYFTGARPESEPCRLTHGDVEFQSNGSATVAYTDTKNEASVRTLPVPQFVADQLRSIMLKEPSRFEKEAHAEWKDTPIFRKYGSREPMDRYSYDKAWKAALSTVQGLDEMWTRDLRPTARTVLAEDERISFEVAERFIGHSLGGVADRYIRLSDFSRCADSLAAHINVSNGQQALVAAER